MRKNTFLLLSLLLALCLLFTGCASIEELQGRYQALVTGTVTLETAGELNAFLDKYLKRFDDHTADHMVMEYELYLTNYCSANPDKVKVEGVAAYFDQATHSFHEEKLQKSEFKDFLQELEEANLKLVWYEGALRVKVNYDSLLSRFGAEVSEPVRKLFELQALTVNQPMMQNAVLQISLQQVLDRAALAEELLVQYKEEHLITTDALELYKLYINTLLMGTTNSPVIDYKSGVFSAEAKKVYEDFLLQHPDTVTGWVLNEYFTYLSGVDYTVNYSNGDESKVFFDTCAWLVSQAEKRVTQ